MYSQLCLSRLCTSRIITYLKYFWQSQFAQCTCIFNGMFFLISRNCYSKFAYLEYNLEPQRDQTCVKIIRLSRNGLNCNSWLIWLDWPLIPACQLDQKDAINFNIFSLFSHSTMHYTVMILSALISLYPKHTNVYKTVTQILSKLKWFANCEVPRDST